MAQSLSKLGLVGEVSRIKKYLSKEDLFIMFRHDLYIDFLRWIKRDGTRNQRQVADAILSISEIYRPVPQDKGPESPAP